MTLVQTQNPVWHLPKVRLPGSVPLRTTLLKQIRDSINDYYQNSQFTTRLVAETYAHASNNNLRSEVGNLKKGNPPAPHRYPPHNYNVLKNALS